MTIKDAITLFGFHQRSNLKARTVQNYPPILQRFETRFEDRSFDSIGSYEIYQFFGKPYGETFQIYPLPAVCAAESLLQFPHREVQLEHEKSLWCSSSGTNF